MKKIIKLFTSKKMSLGGGTLLLLVLLLISCTVPMQNEYLVTFYPSNGTLSGSAIVTVLEGATVDKPGDPTREGYTFTYWATEDGSEYDFNTPVTRHLILYATWEPIQVHSVTFISDGSEIDQVSVRQGNTIAKPETPEKEGHTFDGWVKEDGTSYDFNTTITADLKLTAKWSINSYTVTLTTSIGSWLDGETTKSRSFPYGTYYIDIIATLASDDPVVYYDQRPSGWGTSPSGEAFEEDATLKAEDLTLYAIWSPHTVTFDMNDGSGSSSSETVDIGLNVAEPEDPTREGYSFKGWVKDDGTTFDFNTPITEDLTLKADWEINSYTVTFITSEGSWADGSTSKSDTFTYGTAYSDVILNLSSDNPEMPDYKFIGWYDADGSLLNTNSSVRATTTFYAKWEKLAVVTFSYYGLDTETTQTVGEDYKLSAASLREPENFNGHFLGWFTENDEEVSANTEIKADTTIYPRWTNYSVYNNTYIVFSESGLKEWATVAQSDLTTGCVVAANISLPEPASGQSNWTPIGTSSNPYTGTFDGFGHTISNVKISTSLSHVGFFGATGTATIKNLILENIDIQNASSAEYHYVGAISGYVDNTAITNCRVSGKITDETTSDMGTTISAGGIAGNVAGGNIIGCISDMEITLPYSTNQPFRVHLGGLIGHIESGDGPSVDIYGCISAGTLSACAYGINNIGGFAGYYEVPATYPITTMACYSTAEDALDTGSLSYGFTARMKGTSESCYWGKEVYRGGYGEESSYANVYLVDTWENAMNAMNTTLANNNINFRYELNPDTNNTSMPLIIKPYNP